MCWQDRSRLLATASSRYKLYRFTISIEFSDTKHPEVRQHVTITNRAISLDEYLHISDLGPNLFLAWDRYLTKPSSAINIHKVYAISLHTAPRFSSRYTPPHMRTPDNGSTAPSSNKADAPSITSYVSWLVSAIARGLDMLVMGVVMVMGALVFIILLARQLVYFVGCVLLGLLDVFLGTSLLDIWVNHIGLQPYARLLSDMKASPVSPGVTWNMRS